MKGEIKMSLQEKLTNAKLADDLFRDLSPKEKKFEYLMAKISSKILEERLSRNMSQKEFAKFMGVSQGLVSRWENGNENFTYEKTIEIFEKLNIDFDISFIPRSEYYVIPTGIWAKSVKGYAFQPGLLGAG